MSVIPKRHGKVLMVLLYVALAVGGVVFVLPRVISWFWPFLLAYVIAWMIEPVVRFCVNQLRIPRKLASAVILIIAVGLLGMLLYWVGSKISHEIGYLANSFPEIKANATEYIQYFVEHIKWLPEEVRLWIENITSNFGTYLWQLIQNAAQLTISAASGIISAVPGAVVGFVVFLISSYFISSDRVRIHEALKRIMPHRITEIVTELKNSLSSAVIAYFRAQLILMCITFVELFVWFSILKVEYALLMAALIAIFDAFPILGAGAFLVPWAVISLFTANYRMAIFLVVIYGVHIALRQFLEPKLVSSQIGLHPLLTIMSMYIGLKVLGFFGLIIGPALLIIINNLAKAGFFSRILKGDEEDEKKMEKIMVITDPELIEEIEKKSKK